ncbi:MAG: OprO/OprP family phosphate-selective porin [Planctomycetes bacterium]|nr:OprO/OprP family phosphate-selective porin [Planctomycetota bacterium]
MLSMLLACLSVGSLGVTSDDGDRSWTSLDSELTRLGASLQEPTSAIRWDGYLRVLAVQDSDSPAFAGLPNSDVAGFVLDRVRLGLAFDQGMYSGRVQLEAAGGTARLLDAYASWQCNDMLRTTFGRFQTPLYWNGLVDPRHQLFVLRTASDEFWIGGRPTQLADNFGVMLDGKVDRFHWWVAAQNGVDGTADEFAFTARARYDVLGSGIGMVEGAYGAPDDATLSVGVGWFDDGGAVDGGGNSADGDCVAVDTQYANGPWAMNAEVLDYGKNSVNVFDVPDSTPWAVTLSYMLQPNQWELAARYQDVDSPTNLTDITLGVNYYVVGHDVKWQLNVVDTSSDNSVEETTSIALALTLGK